MDSKIVDSQSVSAHATLNQGWIYTEQIATVRPGQTVLDYYAQRYRHSSRAVWRSRIESQQILVNHQPVSADTLLSAGQQLAYHRPPWYEPNVPLDFEVLYEDEALWAIAKPSGLPVLPGGGFLNHTLLHQLRCRYLNDQPTPIHRLGRGTSGVMLVARSPLARSHLSRQLRTHTMTKIYRALVGPGEIPAQFTITHPIGKVPHPTLGDVYGASPSGKRAHSEGRVLEQREDSTLLEVTILTGRPHQIRIHLAAYGYPLLGDPLYGLGGVPKYDGVSKDDEESGVPKCDGALNDDGESEDDGVLPNNGVPKDVRAAKGIPVPGDCGYWLHAHQLGFNHPCTEKRMIVTCPAPALLRCK